MLPRPSVTVRKRSGEQSPKVKGIVASEALSGSREGHTSGQDSESRSGAVFQIEECQSRARQ